MRFMIMLCVAAALGLVLLFAGCGDEKGKNNSQASVSTGTVDLSELSPQEIRVSETLLTRI